MKATGIIRRIDDLGRVVIPKEIRRSMGIKEGDPLEIYVDQKAGTVIFQKYRPIDEVDWCKLKKLIGMAAGAAKFTIFDSGDEPIHSNCGNEKLGAAVWSNALDVTITCEDKATCEMIEHFIETFMED